MEENKFEKQVQQKMDELKIQPSDAVWKKIEVRIEKKKSRKWGMLILFLFACFILSGGYWLWNSGQQRFAELNKSAKTSGEKNNDQTSAKENRTFPSKINSVPGPVIQKNIEGANEQTKDENKSSAKHYKVLTGSGTNQKMNLKEETPAVFFKEKKVIAEIGSKKGSEITSGQASEEGPADKKEDKKIKDSTDQKPRTDSLSDAVMLHPVTKKDLAASKQKNAHTETVKRPVKNHWEFGIVFSGGLSGAGNDFLGLTNSAAYAYSSAANPGNTPAALPSVTKSGFGFLAGAFAGKNISKKVKLALGINFRSFNTTFQLSDSGGRYTARSVADKYINHFNFVEFPVSVKIQIGKGKNIPLLWQGGLVVSELVNSNALQFNPSTGYYYNDNSFFNKTQIGFNTALFTSLFAKQKASILIGPCFYYDASEIAKENLYGKKHFVYTGLRTEIIFGK